MENFNDLLDFLKHPEGKYFFPQIVFAERGKDFTTWFPAKTEDRSTLELRTKLNDAFVRGYKIGFTGRFYPSLRNFSDEPENELHFLTLDIDCEEGDFNEIYIILVDALKDVASIRTSTSGIGFHIIFRLDRVVRNSTRLIREKILKPYVDLLESYGVPICSMGCNTYLLGGKQRFLTKTENRIHVPDTVIDSEPLPIVTFKIPPEIPLNKDGEELLGLLFSRGILRSYEKTNVYVKELFNLLKDTQFAFKTKSPMQSEHRHMNGFIYFSNRDLCIWTNADGKTVLRIEVFV